MERRLGIHAQFGNISLASGAIAEHALGTGERNGSDEAFLSCGNNSPPHSSHKMKGSEL